MNSILRFLIAALSKHRTLLLCSSICLLAACGTSKDISTQNTPAEKHPQNNSFVFGGLAFSPNSTWSEVADVNLHESSRSLLTQPGHGVLFHDIKTDYNGPTHLISLDTFSDVSIQLEFALPKSTHSGIYLLGRYRLNISDIYGAKNLWPGLMGGIHPRYDDEREWKNYDGVPAKVNAAKPPGEWQTLEIDFRAPRFDELGYKTAYAQFISVKVNGVTVQENAVATGPSGWGLANNDVAEGPIVFMGGAGQVAFRNLKVQAKDFSQVVSAKPVKEQDKTPLGAKSGKPMLNLVDLGKKVFLDKGCKECHEINPAANSVKTGPSLYNVFAPKTRSLKVFDTTDQHVTPVNADQQYLVDSLRFPNKFLAIRLQNNGKEKQFLPIMPAFNQGSLSEAETQQLYAYLLSLNDEHNAGAKVVWQEQPEKPYVLSEDVTAELVGKDARLVRVNIGPTVSGRAYHVGLPNHMNYSFDPRTMAIEMVWSGRYLSLKNEKQGRADAPSEPGKAAKIWPTSTLAHLFQPIANNGQPIDFSFSEPPKVNAQLSGALLEHQTDFDQEVAKVDANFIGVDTLPQSVPVFHYQVGSNKLALQFEMDTDNRLRAVFDFTNVDAQELSIKDAKLNNISVTIGKVENGIWRIPAGKHEKVIFTAQVEGAPKFHLPEEDGKFSQQNEPQPMTWSLAQGKQQSLPAGYTIEHGSVPKDTFGRDILFEPLGIVFNSAGDAYVSTRTAGIWTVRNGNWQQFAEGVFGSLGLVLNDDNTLVIGEKPGLTRLIDEDGDGWAERREIVSDAFRFNSNYHEYLHGPAKTSGGGYLFTLNLAHGLPGGYGGGGMNTNGGYRGWAMEVTAEGKTMPYASGLRSPAGIATNKDGEAFYTDNQGDFFGTSKLFRLKKGEYYGHPAGLVDLPGRTVNSPDIRFENMAPKRALALGLLPHSRAMNSPGSPIWDESAGQFGAYAGQMFVGDQSQSNIFRVHIESVDGVEQSALLPFVAGTASGAMRLTFSPLDNSLWIGQTGRGWWAKGGNLTGLQRVKWDGKTTPQSMHSISVKADGFVVNFTRPIAERDRNSFEQAKVSSWFYVENSGYGSDETGLRDEVISDVVWEENGQSVRITLANFVLETDKPVEHTSRVYEIDLGKTAFAQGLDAFQTKAWYTLNAIPKQ